MENFWTHIALTEFWPGVVWGLAPTVLVGLLFWVIMRAIMRADRTERKVYAQVEAEERAKRMVAPNPPAA